MDQRLTANSNFFESESTSWQTCRSYNSSSAKVLLNIRQPCISSFSKSERSSTDVPGLEAVVVIAEFVVVDCGRASRGLSKLLV